MPNNVDLYQSWVGTKNGYFYENRFVPAVKEWAANPYSNKTLAFIIRDAEFIAAEEPFAPSLTDFGAISKWCIDQEYSPSDQKLLVVFIEDWNSAYSASSQVMDPAKNGNGSAAEKYAQTEDWKISFECGVRTIFTLGLEPALNEQSPCRVPPVEGKTGLDAFQEGVTGAVKVPVSVVGDTAKELVKETNETLTSGLTTIAIVAGVAAFAVFLVVASRGK